MFFFSVAPPKQAAAYVPSPTTNFLSGEGEEGSEVQTSAQLRPTEEQYAFGKLLQLGMGRLFDSLHILRRPEHRIYESEIIELSEDVNLILILPPAQNLVQMTDSDPGNCLPVQNGLIPIGLHSFEVLHLGTYFSEILSNFVKVSNLIEIELLLAKHLLKDLKDPSESDEINARLTTLNNQQTILDDCWKPVRWLFDILSRFRNRASSSGITFANLTEWYAKQTDFPDDTAVFQANKAQSGQQGENEDGLLMVS